MEIDEDRVHAIGEVPLHIEKAGAARPAQELAAGGRKHVAADGIHVHLQLADRLAGIEQIGNAVRAGHLADLGGGIHQSAVGGNMGDGNEPGASVDHAAERGNIGLAGCVIRNDPHDDALALRDLQVGKIVAGVLGGGRQDDVAGAQRQGIEGHVPGPGRVLDIGDLVGCGADQPSGFGVEAVDCGTRLGLGLVAADLALALQMADDRVMHASGVSDDPALLKCRTCWVPRVSARNRATSCGVIAAGPSRP